MSKPKTLLSSLFLTATLVTSHTQAMNRLLQVENYPANAFVKDLEDLKSYTSELQVVEDYLQKGEVVSAQNRYDAILNTCELSRYDKEEWSAYGLWLDVRKDMVGKGNDFGSLTADNLLLLDDLASIYWNSYAGRNAQEILNVYYEGNHDIEPMVSWGSGGPKGKVTRNQDEVLMLRIYPNPTSDYFIVQLGLQTLLGRHQLVVTDANGKLVHQSLITNAHQQLVIDVQNWASGVYHVTLLKDSTLIETKDVHVVR